MASSEVQTISLIPYRMFTDFVYPFHLGLRSLGVLLLYVGYDPHYNFQLYHSDPSGNCSGWKATCIGANNGVAQSLLKQEYKDDIEVKDAIRLVLRMMSKTMDSTSVAEALAWSQLRVRAELS